MILGIRKRTVLALPRFVRPTRAKAEEQGRPAPKLGVLQSFERLLEQQANLMVRQFGD